VVVWHLYPEFPRVSVPYEGNSQAEKERAEIQEKFGEGFIWRTSTEGLNNPWLDAARNGPLYGVFILKVLHNGAIWDKQRARIAEGKDPGAAFPLLCRAPHPHDTMFDPSPYGPTWVVEENERVVMNEQAKYPDWTPKKNKRPQDNVTWTEVWTPEWYVYLLDGDPVDVQVNPYGKLPYFIRITPQGFESVTKDPEDRIQSRIKPHRAMITLEGKTMNMVEGMVADSINQGGVMPGGTEAGLKPMVKKPDTFYPIPKDVSVVAWPIAVNSVGLEFLNVVSRLIMERGAPNALRGQEGPAGETGYHLAQVMGKAEQSLIHTKAAFDAVASEAVMFAADIVKNVLNTPVTLWAESPKRGSYQKLIKPEDITGSRIKVEFGPGKSLVGGIELLAIEKVKAWGGLSVEGATDMAGVMNPAEEARRREDEMLRESLLPQVAQALGQEAQQVIQEINVEKDIVGIYQQQAGMPVSPMQAQGGPMTGAPPQGFVGGVPPMPTEGTVMPPLPEAPGLPPVGVPQ